MMNMYYIDSEEALRRLENYVGQSYVPEGSISEIFRMAKSKDILTKAGDKVRGNRRIMLAAVKYEGNNLKYACAELKKDREIVLEALNNKGHYMYADRTLFDDRDFVLAAVKVNPEVIGVAGRTCREDERIMREVVKGNPAMIMYAGENIRSDCGIMAEAVRQDGKLLRYALKELKEESKLVLEAVRNNPMSLQYAGEGPRNDREVALTAVNGSVWMIRQVGDRLMKDPSFAGEVLRDHSECMNYFDDEVLREAVRDQALVLSILRTEPGIMDFIEDPVKKDRGFAAKAVTANAAALKYLDDDMRTSLCNDREFLLAALGQKYGYRILENTVRELLTDREFIMEAVKRNGKALNYFGEEAVKDEEIVVTAFEHGYCNAPGGDPEVTEKDYGYLMSDRELRKAVTGKSGRTEQEKCVAMAKKHGVRHLVHFTDVENLGSILKDGMMTRKDLEDRGERAFFSDRQRLDGQTDTISLSIEEPNRLMFAVKRNEYPRRKWCVIRLKTEAVLRNKCYFMSDNAANHSNDRAEIARDERYTVLDFLGMFDYSFTDRKLRRSKIQSEIMCATSIPADAIDSVVFSSAEDVEYYRERYGGKIPFVCDPWYFE